MKTPKRGGKPPELNHREIIFLLTIMIKINKDWVSKCLLHCLEQTEPKYSEAMAHSDGLTKHSELEMWKILEMKKKKIFCFSVKSCTLMRKIERQL